MAGESIISDGSIVRAGGGVVSCDLVGSAALLNLDTNIYYTLNEVGSRIWDLIQRPTRVSAICSDVIARYDVDPNRCYNDVVWLLRELNDAGLIEIGEGPARKIPGA